MVIRRFLFSWVCLLASSLFMYGQVAVKTNVAIDAVAIPNLGVEVGLSKKLTVDLPFYYNPWKYSDNKMLKLVMVQPELRYWLCDKFNGHFFGFHLMGGADVYKRQLLFCQYFCGNAYDHFEYVHRAIPLHIGLGENCLH